MLINISTMPKAITTNAGTRERNLNPKILDRALRGGGLPRARAAPTLSQSLLSANGGLIKDFKPTAVHLPPLFANKLPEGKLRETLEKHHGAVVLPGNDFDLMVALGKDLPGAVVATPTEGVESAASASAELARRARFSLAGVQMKLRVFKNRRKGSGLTVALDDDTGNYIAKFPSMNFPLAEDEYAMLALAAAVGMDVPKHELVSQADFEGIPEEFAGLADGKVLIVERFDRGPGGSGSTSRTSRRSSQCIRATSTRARAVKKWQRSSPRRFRQKPP